MIFNYVYNSEGLRFPKPLKKKKAGAKFGSKKKMGTVVLYENEVFHMLTFYETHRGDMSSIENYLHTKKANLAASKWITDVMISQRCDSVKSVILAWEQAIIHASEKAHSSHKVDSFMNFWWLVKNDSNYLEVIDGKYDKEFTKRNAQAKGTQGWGDPKDFEGIKAGEGETVV